MNEIKLAAMNKAIQLLSVAGVEFAVKTPDGVVGTLKVTEEKAKRYRHKWKDLGWNSDIKKMGVGDVLVFPVLDGRTTHETLSTVSGYGAKHFGPESFMCRTTNDKKNVECMRLK